MDIWQKELERYGDKLGVSPLPSGPLRLSDVAQIGRMKAGQQNVIIYRLADKRTFRVSQRIHKDILAILNVNGIKDCVVEITTPERGTRRAIWQK